MIHSWIEELTVNGAHQHTNMVKELTFEDFCYSAGSNNVVVFLCIVEYESASIFVIDSGLNRQGTHTGFQIHPTGTSIYNFRPAKDSFPSQVSAIIQKNLHEKVLIYPFSEDGTSFNSLMSWEQTHSSEVLGMKLSVLYRKKGQSLTSAVKNDFPSEKHKKVCHCLNGVGDIIHLNGEWFGYTGGLWMPQDVYYKHWRGIVSVISYLPKRLSNLSPFVLVMLDEEDEGFEPPNSTDFQCVQLWAILKQASNDNKYTLSFFRASNVPYFEPETPSKPLDLDQCIDLVFLKCIQKK